MSGGHEHGNGHAHGAGDPREEGHHIAHFGRGGVLEVSVPVLPDEFPGLGKAVFIDELESMSSKFTPAERLALIDQAILCLDHFYVHRAMKWTKHAVDPVRALTRLRRVCGEMADLEFHTEVARVFKSLRDIHTAYVLPEPYRNFVAFLPFTLGSYRDRPGGPPRVVVRDLLESLKHPHFRAGSELLTWNGIGIEQAIRSEGLWESGSNPHAQFALGARLMTVRWLGGSLPPLAHWVTIGYLDPLLPDGSEPPGGRGYHEIRFSWRMLDLTASGQELLIPLQAALLLEGAAGAAAEDGSRTLAAAKRAYDRRGTIETMVQRVSFGDTADKTETQEAVKAAGDRVSETIDTSMPDVFEARIRIATTKAGPRRFGYLRIHHFLAGPDDFVAEFARLLALMPEDRLVIDLRSNAGGEVGCAERVIQFLTPRRVTPLPFQFAATPGTEMLVTGAGDNVELAPWGELVSKAVASGYMFSRAMPLTPEEQANDTGQLYWGSVALLVDGITYSSGDIFAALFADHGIGPIVGVDPGTGGGGANMWFFEDISAVAPRKMGLRNLPGSAQIHLAVRRFVRVGEEAGSPVEEDGVVAGVLHQPTHADLMQADRDLMRTAVAALDAAPRRLFRTEVKLLSRDQLRITVETDPHEPPLNLDIYLDDRPVTAAATEAGLAVIEEPINPEGIRQVHLRIEAHLHHKEDFGRIKRDLVAVLRRDIPLPPPSRPGR